MADIQDKLIIVSEARGFNETQKSIDGVVVAFENTEKSAVSLENRFKSLERQLGTTAGQQAKFEKAQRDINLAVAQNPSLQGRATEALAAAEAKYLGSKSAVVALTEAHAGLSSQGQALFHSLRSVGEQLALGVPPTQALTGQINHLTYAASGQGGLSGAFGEVAGTFGKMITPMRLVAGGVLGIGAAALYIGNNWHEASAQIERSLIGIGAKTGETVQSLNKFSSDNASLAGLSVAQTRNIATEFTKTGSIAVSGLKGVGDAIRGYTVLTGKDATEATKTFAEALSGDLVEGAKKIDQTYGVLNSATLEYIRTLELQGDRSAAVQVILDKIKPANEKAAASVGILSKAYTGLTNVISNVFNGVPSSTPDQEKLASLQAQREQVANSRGVIAKTVGGYLDPIAQFGGKSQQLAELDKQIDALQKKIGGFKTDGINGQLVAMSKAGDAVVRSVIPQIDQIDQLQKALVTLQNAQNTPGVSRGLGQDNAAVTAIQNQIAGLQDAQGQAERYNQRVAEISQSWGNVGQSTALSLQAASNMQPVYEAVGGAAKMAAQYTADYKNAIDAGKTSTEAAALASSNMAASQAQVNANAQDTLAKLRDQQAVAGAVNGLQQIRAQSEATYNDLLRQGVDAGTARAIASQQEANARAKATATVLQQTEALRDSTEMIKAQQNGTEATTAAAIAYKNAIQAGASSTAAAALSAETLENALTKSAIAAQKMEQAQLDQQNYQTNGVYDPSKNPGVAQKGRTNQGPTDFAPEVMTQSGAFQLGQEVNGSYTGGGGGQRFSAFNSYAEQKNFRDAAAKSAAARDEIDKQIAALTSTDLANSALSQSGGSLQAAISAAMASNKSDSFSTLQSLFGLLNSQTSDKNVQIGNDQQFLAWLQSQPQTIANLSAIASLTDEIEKLKSSTDDLNSTNQALLSPYYSQDPRTSHIGFRSQGMASTGYIDIPGVPSANDNMTLTLPVASGERVMVGNGPNRGGSSQTIQLTQHITIAGNANKDEVGRTMYQAGQTLARQLAAASR